ncbi:phage major capsid protein [Paracoccus versutus]|uniref:HK97 family phage major capsid protein n=2 Tax=Paracoccus versutus TaxID=34007 RepID=A0A3D9XKK9_PARVE|nr:phage major capsid protein [Paracoccus versutus]REF69643.1 HK97 family phage major capsid protein [Paracoccus versutus]SFY21068.1 phage major capsid protein, HK97 family [Paracoccus pantotrophus]
MKMNTIEQFANAGLLGPLARKDAFSSTDTLPTELKGFATEVGKAFKELRDTNDQMLKAKADGKSVSDLEAKTVKMQESIDTLEKSITDGLKTIRAEKAADEIKADDRLLASDFALNIKGQKVSLDEVTPDLMKEAKNYEADFSRWLRTEGKALTSGIDPSGGYWVPTTTSRRIITKLHETTPMRQLATVEETNGDKWEIENDRGIVPARWVDDTTAHQASGTPKTGMRAIMVHNLQAQPRASSNLLEDASRNVEQWLADKVALGFALAEASAFVLGDGVGKPRGLLTYPEVEYVKASDKTDADWRKMRFVKSGAAAALGGLDGFAHLITSLKSLYRINATFMMNRMTVGALRVLKDGEGRYLLDPMNQNRGVASIFGFPISEGDDLDEVGAGKIPVVLGDIRAAYTIVQRRGIRVLRDPYTAKPMVQFDHTARVGGDVVDFDAFRVLKIAA